MPDINRGTIPAGLKANLMRERMEDKATIANAGSLYVGGLTSTVFVDENGNNLSGYVTEELKPSSTVGLPLVSKGAGAKPAYEPINTVGISNKAVTKDKMGSGTIVTTAGNNDKMILEIAPSTTDPNILEIRYYSDPNQ